jgi:hypothetical protein
MSTNERSGETTSKTTSPTEATPAARTLAIYRTQLADLLAQAETAAQDGSAKTHFDVGRLVERLSADLIRLYDDSQRGALAQSDRLAVLPTLESMREVLRHAWSRPRSLLDTLYEALGAGPGSPL